MRHNLSLIALAAIAGVANAQQLPLDPNVPIQQFSTNSNDGYREGRGIFFQANSNVLIQGAGFYNGFGQGDGFTMTMWSADSNGSNLRVQNLGSFTVNNPTVGDVYSDGFFNSNISLVAGQYYHIEVVSNSTFDRNFFYNWNGPSRNLGAVTIIDGSQGADLSNTVAPVLRLNVVPEPATMLALGAGLAAIARRRKA